MILVISLIVLGLAQISRREVRKSTDNLLNSQAFYAAESGVNDVIRLIHANGNVVTPKPSCDMVAPYNTSLTPIIAPDVSYTCVIVEPSPDTVTGGFTTTPAVFSLATASGTLSSATLKWTPGTGLSGGTNGCATTALSSSSNINIFPTGDPVTGPWSCNYAVLRVDLVDASTLSRDALTGNARTYFFVPNRSGSTGTGNTTVVGATCSSASSTCTATVALPASGAYYARISGIYRDGTATICANACDGSVSFKDYATIDVTGKAQDVLRRIKVSVNLAGGNQNSKAGAAIMSGDSICKRFKLNETGTATGSYAGVTGCN
jgi:Tfp pilus assembly protein PilX